MSVTTANLRTNAYGVQPASTGTVSPLAAALAARAAAQIAAADGSLPPTVRAAWAATATAWGETGTAAEEAWHTARLKWIDIADATFDPAVVETLGYLPWLGGADYAWYAWQSMEDQETWSNSWSAVDWFFADSHSATSFHVFNSLPSHLAACSASSAAGSAYQNSQASEFIPNTSTDPDTVSSIDLSTAAGAKQALGIVDSALTTISDERAKHGALQSRFETVVQNLKINAENASASVSRIVDADYAIETSQLARAQILQQAGTAMVTQANQAANNVMALLRS